MIVKGNGEKENQSKEIDNIKLNQYGFNEKGEGKYKPREREPKYLLFFA